MHGQNHIENKNR